MKTVKVLEITRKGNDFGVKVPAGTIGQDVEIGLATAIVQLAEHAGMTPVRLLRGIESWVTSIKESQ